MLSVHSAEPVLASAIEARKNPAPEYPTAEEPPWVRNLLPSAQGQVSAHEGETSA